MLNFSEWDNFTGVHFIKTLTPKKVCCQKKQQNAHFQSQREINFIKADFDGVKTPKLKNAIFAYLETFGVIHLGEKKLLFGGNIF